MMFTSLVKPYYRWSYPLVLCYNDDGDNMNQETIEKTYALIDEILETKTFIAFKEAKKALDDCSKATGVIETFNAAKTKYEDAKQYGKYHPDLKRYQRELQVAKTELFNHPRIQEYKRCERAFSEMLDDIALRLAAAISPRIAVDTANTFKKNGGVKVCKTEKA